MGKTRDPFKKIRVIKGMFHARMGMIKDINCKDIIEAEEIIEVTQIHRTTIQERSS